MSDPHAFNGAIVEEFRANDGQLSGNYEGEPVVLVHSVGRKTGVLRVKPMLYRPHPEDRNVIYVFASGAGRPKSPSWYHNITSAGRITIEVGPETYEADVRELKGEERDAVFAAHVEAYPRFADFQAKCAGVRLIPVIELTRA